MMRTGPTFHSVHSLIYGGCIHLCEGPGSSVGIATELRAGQSGDRIPVEARFSAPVQTSPRAHPASCTMGTESFPGVKSAGAWRWPLTPSSAVVKKEYRYTSTLAMGRKTCTEPQCLYRVQFTFTFYSSAYLLPNVVHTWTCALSVSLILHRFEHADGGIKYTAVC